jgi:YD repeat-containing protein
MNPFKNLLCTISLVFPIFVFAATTQSSDVVEVDTNDPLALLSETQSARLTMDGSGRPHLLVRGSAVVGQFSYDGLGRVVTITTTVGSRTFQYNFSSKRPISAWISKAGSTQPWRMSNGLTEANILDTIATFNEAPQQALQRVRVLVEATMLSALSESAQQLYKNFGSQKTLSIFDVLICETPFSCFACLGLCNRVADRAKRACDVYRQSITPGGVYDAGAEAQYIECMNSAAQLELFCGLTCL